MYFTLYFVLQSQTLTGKVKGLSNQAAELFSLFEQIPGIIVFICVILEIKKKKVGKGQISTVMR